MDRYATGPGLLAPLKSAGRRPILVDRYSFRLYTIDVQVVGGQGGIIELEPDLVMYVYSAGYEEPNLRSQRFRVERGAGRLVVVPSVAVASGGQENRAH